VLYSVIDKERKARGFSFYDPSGSGELRKDAEFPFLPVCSGVSWKREDIPGST
jgi:hypothetical protein